MLGLGLGLMINEQGSAAAANPASLPLTGWWQASFDGSPWTSIASAGTSGSAGDLVEATNPPSVGSAVNGFTPTDFDGTNNVLTCEDQQSSFFVNSDAYSFAFLFYADASTAADPGDNAAFVPGLWQDSGGNGNPCGGYCAGGFRFGHYTGTEWKSAVVACATGAWHLCQARYNGTNIEVRIDGGSWVQVAAANVSPLANQSMKVGPDVIGRTIDGKLLEILISDVALSDAQFDVIRAYCSERYAISV